MPYTIEQLVPGQIGSTLSGFMPKLCPTCTNTGTCSGISDRLVKLCPLVDQTCFEFLEASYPEVVNLLLQHAPDAVFDQVKIRRIRWPLLEE